MDRLEHLLTIAAEECVEVAQRISKAARFGLHEKQPDQDLDNAERIRREYVDLLATLLMIEREADHFVALTIARQEEIARKQEKIERYLAYSQQQGTLS